MLQDLVVYNCHMLQDLAGYDCHMLQDLAVYDCPFLSEHPVDFLAYKMPVFTLLVCNTFFLVWIMVVSKYISS